MQLLPVEPLCAAAVRRSQTCRASNGLLIIFWGFSLSKYASRPGIFSVMTNALISNICIFFSKQAVHEVSVNTRVSIREGGTKTPSRDGSGLRKQPHHISPDSSMRALHMTEVSAQKPRADSAGGGKKREMKMANVRRQTAAHRAVYSYAKYVFCAFCLHLLMLRSRSRKQVAKKKKRVVRSYKKLLTLAMRV